MTRSRFTLWFSTLALLLGLAAQAPAQNSDTPATAAGGAITDEDLPKMLENLGYEIEKVDEGVYRVSIEQNDWSYYLRFSLSTDNKARIWMTSSFGEIKDWQKVPSGALLDLLMANDRIGPAHFYVSASGDARRLNIARSIDNRGVTPVVLRNEMEKFLANIRDSVNQWDMSKWVEAGTASAEATPPPPAEDKPTPAPEEASTETAAPSEASDSSTPVVGSSASETPTP